MRILRMGMEVGGTKNLQNWEILSAKYSQILVKYESLYLKIVHIIDNRNFYKEKKKASTSKKCLYYDMLQFSMICSNVNKKNFAWGAT